MVLRVPQDMLELGTLWWGHMRQGQILSIQRGAIPCATRQMERTATLVHG